MPQTGYTPIQIYSTSTAAAVPTAGSLTNSTLGSELAINITDGKLFYKDNANVVQVIGWKVVPTSAGGTGLTSFTANQVFYASSTSAVGQSANLSFNGTTLGVGGAANASYGISITSSTLTGLGQIGVFSTPTITSAATTGGYGYYARVFTEAASFTVADVFGLRCVNASKGAGSTITNQYGIYVDDQTQGTNNYGIRALVSSGANKWNIYASGTAANYFAGNVGIGTATVGSPLTVVGAAGYIVTLDGATDTRLDFKNSGTRNGIIQTTASAFQFNAPTAIPMLFLTNNTNRMRIDSAGFTQFNSNLVMPYQGAPTSKAAAATLTGAELITGILNTTGTTYTITLPTGTDIEGALSWSANNVALDWWVINTASGTITIGANGNTTLGTLTIATGVSAHFRIRRTAANTFTVYRLS